jgi:hypothetical protein
MLARAGAAIGNAEQMLRPRKVAYSAPARLYAEGDPQPHIDHEVLERLFNHQNKYL